MPPHKFLVILLGLAQVTTNRPPSPVSRLSEATVHADAQTYVEAPGETVDYLVAHKLQYSPELGAIVLRNTRQEEVAPGRDGARTSLDDLRDLILNCDGIVTGVSTQTVSALTQNRTFVFSDYLIHITNVYYDKGVSLEPSQDIVISKPGGDVVLEGQNVHAIDQGFPQLKAAVQYVLFLHYNPGTRTFRVGPSDVYYWQAGKVSALRETSRVLPRSLDGTEFQQRLAAALTSLAGR